MEALLIQSQRVCPFLKKTSPSTLRSLSTSVAHNASVGGGKMTNLQVLGRRCPVMGKAMAVQSSRMANTTLSGAFGGARAYHSKVNRKIHTSSDKKARAVEVEMLRHEPGMFREDPQPYTAHERQKSLTHQQLPSLNPLVNLVLLLKSTLTAMVLLHHLLRLRSSITMLSTKMSSTRSTRTSLTATSTTSTVSRLNFLVPT